MRKDNRRLTLLTAKALQQALQSLLSCLVHKA